MKTRSYTIYNIQSLQSKFQDLKLLIKLGLTTSVVISALLGYLIADFQNLKILNLMYLFIGGFLVVCSANIINQIIEIQYDKLMDRTKSRPLVTQKYKVLEAWIGAILCGLIGILILKFCFNNLTAFLGLLSLICYAFVYTPFKRISPIAVYIGAIPGAIPPLLGYVASTGSIGNTGIILFLIQFAWQFPHFWSISWILNDDYIKAKYYMMPTKSGRTRKSALIILLSSFSLILISIGPYLYNISGYISLCIIILLGIGLIYFALQLYKHLKIENAKKLMHYTIVYNLAIYILILIDKI